MFEALLAVRPLQGLSVPDIAMRIGIGTTEWQLRAELGRVATCGNSGRTPHFHVTSIKYAINYN
jgi:hypothetical protein